MNVNLLLAVLMVAPPALLVGCGGGAKTCPVTGRVTLPGDRPLAGATVTFKSADDDSRGRPRGQTDESGYFELRLDENRTGALPGVYQATVNEALGDDIDAIPQPKIDACYSSFEESGLQYTVKPGSNHFDIQVAPPEG